MLGLQENGRGASEVLVCSRKPEDDQLLVQTAMLLISMTEEWMDATELAATRPYMTQELGRILGTQNVWDDLKQKVHATQPLIERRGILQQQAGVETVVYTR